MSLQQDWSRACEALNQDGEGFWKIFEEHYTKGQLAYHNLDHIADCLSQFRASPHLAQNPTALEFAIWFHDIVYDPKASDNEEQSARLAVSFLRDSPLSTEVEELILDTKHRKEPTTNDGKLLCDIDLSILGRDPESYRVYANAIREEYSWVSSADYTLGRSRVLENFLAREHIYALPDFREKYEQQARTNILKELQLIASS